MLNSGRLYNLPALKINARRITNATSLSICHNHVQYILCSSGVVCVLSLFSKQQRTRDHWTDVKDIFNRTYTLTCAALNICGQIKMCARQTKCRRTVDPLKASLRSAASSSEWVKVSGRRRFRRKHKGREGGSFPVKIDKEIRIYALQLWTFLGISFWGFFLKRRGWSRAAIKQEILHVNRSSLWSYWSESKQAHCHVYAWNNYTEVLFQARQNWERRSLVWLPSKRAGDACKHHGKNPPSWFAWHLNFFSLSRLVGIFLFIF